jgi:hypothetical protein
VSFGAVPAWFWHFSGLVKPGKTMSRPTPSKRLTHHEVASLLTGSVDPEERKLLLTRLASDSEARELLQMALEALKAAEEEDRSQGRHAA